MKLKSFNLSFLILIGLMFLSFAFFVVAEEEKNVAGNIFLDSDQDGLSDAEEKTYGTNSRNKDSDGDGYSDGTEIKAGYNPLKPAPGDKITKSETENVSAVLGQSDTKNGENLTQKLSQKISQITTSSDSENQELSVEDIQALVDEALNANATIDSLPEIKKEDIKIKEQNYSGSSEKVKELKKNDFVDYITSVFYIISSNSPKPLTSSSNVSSVISGLISQILGAVEKRNSSVLSDISKSGEKISEQLKKVDVPEDLVELHIKALSYAEYSKEIGKNIDPNQDDPIKDIANFSKIRAYISSLSSFSEEAVAKFSEYDVTYDETIKNKLKSLGVDPPDLDNSNLSQILQEISGTTDFSSITSEE